VSATVTIVTPAYNAAKYLAETIDSVQAQTWRDWEWIVVDDGSTDDTARLIDARATSDDRITVIRQRNGGVPAARNRGLAEMRGPLAALLDADDLWSPHNLERKVAALEADRSVLFVFSNMYRYSEQLRLTTPSAPGKAENLLENLLLWNGDVIPCLCSNIVFRRSVVDAGLRFDPRFSTAADLDFAFRLARTGQGRLLDERLLTYRVRPDSMSRDLGLAERDLIAVYENAATLGLFRNGWFQRRCFAQLYLILAGGWWIDGGDRRRALRFILRAILFHPWAAGQLIRKLWCRLGAARV
jgi:glycosyltransferase involved in cell wall biosynthesis